MNFVIRLMHKKFEKKIKEKYNVKLAGGYWDLHKWSVDHLEEFWDEFWNFVGIIHSKNYSQVIDLKVPMEDSTWFPGAKLNYAENLLKYRDDHPALIVAGEDRAVEKVTYAQMFEEAKLYAAALRKFGLKRGDRVICYMPNRKEPIFAMLGVTSIGAIWTGELPLLGSQAALNRFKQVSPRILFTVDRFQQNMEENDMLGKVKEIAEGLPSLEKVVIVPSKEESKLKDISGIRNSCFLDEFLQMGYEQDGSVPPMIFEQVSFAHPVFISYTSGTTGLPKALIHGSGVLLTITKDFFMHADSKRDYVTLSISPVGWATWNMFITMHSTGTTLLLFEGVPYFLSPTYLWDMVDDFKVSRLYLTPNILDDLEKKGYLPTEKNHLSSLKVIMSGASVVKPQNCDFVYKKVKKDIVFAVLYGCTEFLGPCIIQDHTFPIYRGELSSPSLGIDAACFDEAGKPVIGDVGDLVLRKPTPSMPLGLWGDSDGSLFKKIYFSQFPGAFAVGDMAMINPVTKGIIFLGRSDATLKPEGCRFGSSEIYNIVDTFPEVQDSLCVSQLSKERDERAVLFIKMRNGHPFNENLARKIRATIARELTTPHVPAVILETPDIPYNMNGKKVEIIVKKIINHMPCNFETVSNTECLQNFYNVPELQGF